MKILDLGTLNQVRRDARYERWWYASHAKFVGVVGAIHVKESSSFRKSSGCRRLGFFKKKYVSA